MTGKFRSLSTSNCRRLGFSVELRLHRFDLFRKLCFEFPIDRRRRFALLQCGDGIDRSTVLRHLEMKVRPCCKAGLADESYQFTLLYRMTRPYAGRYVR